MHKHLEEWLRGRLGPRNMDCVPVRAVWDGQSLVTHWTPPDAATAEDWEALGAFLSEELTLKVIAKPLEATPLDPRERVLEIVSGDSPALAELLQAGLRYESGRLLCEFNGLVAQTLFRKWGGVRRLREAWPEIPEWDEVLCEPAPPESLPMVNLEPRAEGWHWGKALSPKEAQPLAEVLQGAQRGSVVGVRGQVFRIEERMSREGPFWNALIWDGTSALRLRLYEARGRRASRLGTERPPLPKPGMWVEAQGVLEEDASGETLLRVQAAVEAAKPEFVSPDGGLPPRVELHCHTKMSAMDGLADVHRLFAKAGLLGHAAVAVVDHGVVQAFPEAEEAAHRANVAPIYGIEAHMVEDYAVPLQGPDHGERAVVVLDVETTGLSPRVHEVIEIGAVRVENGEIVGRFHHVIRPTRSVSRGSLAITQITREELDQGDYAEEVWPAFADFSRDAILVAHNAAFDSGFLRASYERFYPPANAEFPVLDTLTLARVVLPGLRSYGLEFLTDYLKIPLTQHHRALVDAEATASVLLKLLEKAASDGDWQAVLRRPWPLPLEAARPTPVVILAASQEGLYALYRLVSESHLEGFYRVPRVTRAQIAAGRRGTHGKQWVVGSPIHGGEIADLLWRGADSRDIQGAAGFYDYWEVAAPGSLATLLREEQLGSTDAIQDYLESMISLGRSTGHPVAAVSDAHYVDAEDAVFRKVLAATQKSEMHDADSELHYRSSRELLDAFAWLPEEWRHQVVFTDPARVADDLEPILPVPETLFAPHLEDAEAVVANRSKERAIALYGDPLPDIVAERLNKEVRAIIDNGFASIYYIAHRLVAKSLADGYLVGSRGSVGSSIVATFLDITEVNPLPPHYRCPQCRHSDFGVPEGMGSGFDLPPRSCPSCSIPMVGDGQDIPFETFLGFEGDKVPDIDLNFSGEYQPEIHRYTEELFGRGHVFRAGTIATVADRTAFGLVKAWERETGATLAPAVIDWLVSGLVGVKRTTGQHPGGLMVVPADEDIHHFSPVQHPADDRDANVITTHFDYHAISSRLLKLDLLGHDDPTAIRMLEDLTGITATAIPFQDPETMSLFSNTEALHVDPGVLGTPVGSLGIPEFGTRFVRGMLVDTHPQSFAELVRISGLSHGTEVWANNAQDIIRQQIAGLSDVIATRDDIMLHLIAKGMPPKEAFAISESVRKGKGVSAAQQEAMRNVGVPDWYIQSCLKISYLFPKAHAVAYVMMGWRIAWFKVHYPLAYYATYFTVRASDFDPEPVVQGPKAVKAALRAIEAKGNEASPKERSLVTVLEIAHEMLLRGFRFYPVDLDRSVAGRFLPIGDDGLLMPFASLPGLGKAQAESIVQARRDGPFLSIDDLRHRAHVSRSTVDLLKRHGVLRDLGDSNQLAFL